MPHGVKITNASMLFKPLMHLTNIDYLAVFTMCLDIFRVLQNTWDLISSQYIFVKSSLSPLTLALSWENTWGNAAALGSPTVCTEN